MGCLKLTYSAENDVPNWKVWTAESGEKEVKGVGDHWSDQLFGSMGAAGFERNARMMSSSTLDAFYGLSGMSNQERAGFASGLAVSGGNPYSGDIWFANGTKRISFENGSAVGLTTFAYSNRGGYETKYDLAQKGTDPLLAAVGAIVIPSGSGGLGAGALAAAEAIPVVGFGILASYGADVLERKASEKTYVTYTKVNPVTGQVYVGRTSGVGTPDQLVARRDQQHIVLNGAGFLPATVDRFIMGVNTPMVMGDGIGSGISAYVAIRGREQQLIDSYGGVGSPGVANIIRGVSPYNPIGPVYHAASTAFFGPLAPYTGY